MNALTATAARNGDPTASMPMAIELRVGDRHTGRREHDHQRRYACDAFIGGAQGRGHDPLEVGCLSVANV